MVCFTCQYTVCPVKHLHVTVALCCLVICYYWVDLWRWFTHIPGDGFVDSGAIMKLLVITVTSWWVRLRLRSPASRLYAQRLFKCRSKKISKSRATGLCKGNSPMTGESPHKGPVTPKMFPFDDVIMCGREVTLKKTGWFGQLQTTAKQKLVLFNISTLFHQCRDPD